MYTSRLARPLTFFIGKWLNLTGIMGFTFLFPLVSALTSRAASRFILHEQNLYQISSNSFLVYANSPGGDPPASPESASGGRWRAGKPRPYNWWWAVPTQTLLVATLGSIPLIFRLQSPSAFRMVGYIVKNHQQDNKHITGALPSKLPNNFKRNNKHRFAFVRIQTNSNYTTEGHPPIL